MSPYVREEETDELGKSTFYWNWKRKIYMVYTLLKS